MASPGRKLWFAIGCSVAVAGFGHAQVASPADGAGSTTGGCVVPSADALAASADPDPRAPYPYQDWVANPAAQDAVDKVNSTISARFGAPGADGQDDPLRAGLIGEALDHYKQQFVVVVDPTLVNQPALEKELQSAADAAAAEALDVVVVDGCHSAGELLDAQAVVDGFAWEPKPEAPYALELDAATSTVSVTFDEKDRSSADGLTAKLGDLVTIDFASVGRGSGGRLSDDPPHWGGARIRHPANDPVSRGTSAFTAEMPVPGGPNGSVTTAHGWNEGWDLFADGFFGEARGMAPLPEFDMMRIHGAGQTTYSRVIHVDPCCPVARDVVDAGNPAGVGSFVCISGSASLSHCGLEIMNMDATLCDPPGFCTGNLFRSHKDGEAVSQNMDSGGPMYNRFGNNDAAIRGMNIGNNGVENSYAHKVSTIRTQLGITRIAP
jgi:hypothetical protein